MALTQPKKDLPFPLGSFELEKRRWLNAPLRRGTLSAENDIIVVCGGYRLSFGSAAWRGAQS
jgi:hypothetical protein